MEQTAGECLGKRIVRIPDKRGLRHELPECGNGGGHLIVVRTRASTGWPSPGVDAVMQLRATEVDDGTTSVGVNSVPKPNGIWVVDEGLVVCGVGRRTALLVVVCGD